jgi:hypothetical protein
LYRYSTCAKIVAHGCNLFINRQLIYNYPEQVLANAGVVGGCTSCSNPADPQRLNTPPGFVRRSLRLVL